MAVKNPTTATEVDPNSHITNISTRASFAGLTRSEDAYNYWDEGVGHFSGDFEFLATITPTSFVGGNSAGYITLANLVDDMNGIKAAGGDGLYLRWEETGGSPYIYLWEDFAGTSFLTSYLMSLSTLYYIKFKRDEAVTTYGTLYCYIYSDSARTNLLATLSLALHEKEDFRYLYMVHSRNTASGTSSTGYIENLDLQEAAAGNPYYAYAQQM